MLLSLLATKVLQKSRECVRSGDRATRALLVMRGSETVIELRGEIPSKMTLGTRNGACDPVVRDEALASKCTSVLSPENLLDGDTPGKEEIAELLSAQILTP